MVAKSIGPKKMKEKQTTLQYHISKRDCQTYKHNERQIFRRKRIPTSQEIQECGADERCIPGNTIAVQADMPLSGLITSGTAFLSKFECSQMPHPLLEHITFVDSPGVLSGEKQRAYDFTGLTSWFAANCDLILLLFDPHKLDITDEFNCVISSLRGHDDKIRVVLNKADQVDTQQVYRALMWLLGKVLNTAEVIRVYIGYVTLYMYIDKFEKLKPNMIQVVDDMLAYDIPNLLKNFKNPYD